MTPVFHASARSWLAGLALATAGVALTRFAAPLLEAGTSLRAFTALGGQITALAGLLVIALGIRRRARRDAPVD